MSRYTRSPPKSYNTKPQIIGICDLEESERTYVQSLLQKLYKSSTSSEDRQSLQKQVSNELCKHFQKSVGVSVIQGDESYLQNGNFALKREPTATIVYNGLLVRLWVREHDIVSESEHFERVKNQMAQSIIRTLSQKYNISITSPEQFKNGNTLMQIAYRVLYSEQNEYLENKLFQTFSTKATSPLANSNKAGNNVIIINSLLKHIKSDNSIQKETWVKELTFYNLLENQDMLYNFINWMIHINYLKSQTNFNQSKNENEPNLNQSSNSQHSNQNSTLPLKHKKSLNNHIYKDMTEEQINSISSNRFRNIEIENQRFKTEENQKQSNDFQNLYFASNLKSKPTEDPIVISPEKGDKIVRKGSFKLLKPKVRFTDDKNGIDSQPKQLQQPLTKSQQNKISLMQQETSKTSNQPNFYEPDELKEISMIESSNNHMNQNMNINQQHMDISQQENLYQENSQIYQPQEVPQNKSIASTPIVQKNQPEVENRKTIPKNLSKPPLSRSSSRKNKENIQNNPVDQNRTIQHSLKKKNFFNFSQSDDIVSTFNYELIEPKKSFGNEAEIHCNSSIQNFGSASKSKLFSKIKELKNEQKNEIRQYVSLENKGKNSQNVIEENEYEVINGNQFNFNSNPTLQENSHMMSGQQSSHQSSSKILKLKNHFLQKELYNLQKELTKQQSSIHEIQDLQNNQQDNNESYSKYHSSHKRSITSLHNQPKENFSTANKNCSFDSTKKSNRKISKINFHQLSEKEKQTIIDWLDTLHFVDKFNIEPNDLLNKFKDGTKFIDLCNHYIGRGKPLPYFSNPKKNAEIHSNFSKIFDYLKSYSQWDHPELLFSYELFIPYPQETPIWNLLFGMLKLFTKRGKLTGKSATKTDSLILSKEQESSRKKSVEKQFELMEDRSPDSEAIKKRIGLKPNQNPETTRKSHSSSRKQSNFSKQVEFVKEIPEHLKHNDLVQQDQENLSCEDSETNKKNQINQNIYFEGYRDRYLRKTVQNSSSKQKFKCNSLETPKKFIQDNKNQNQQSFLYPHIQSIEMKSIRKSSSKKMLENQVKKMENSSCKLLSAKKSSKQIQRGKQLPKITLNMQMKVQKIMKYFKLSKLIDEKNGQKLVKFELLQDPIRNGTLINVMLGKFIPAFEGKYVWSPSSIEHCRQNYMTFFAIIKNKYGQEGFEMFQNYLELIEDLLKGEKTIFYGIAYGLVQLMEKKGFRMQEEFQSVSENIPSTFRAEKEKIEAIIQAFSKNHIEWIRYLERSNPRVVGSKIRTEDDLRKCLSSGILLYAFSQNNSIKPIFASPCNLEQKEANLKKIICYLIQNKIVLQKQDFFGVKGIAQMNLETMSNLIKKLIEYTVIKYGVGLYHGSQQVSIVMRNDENQNLGSKRRIGREWIMNGKQIGLGKQVQDKEMKKAFGRLETTTAEQMNETDDNKGKDKKMGVDNSGRNGEDFRQKREQMGWKTVNVQIPWMRKLGFINCSLSINNGILLCRLISKLTRTNIKFNQNISTDANLSKPESLGNIRKAIKLIPGFTFDQIDIYHADQSKTLQVFQLIKEKFRNTYEITKILTN